jgi:hypothetical protein
MNQLTILHKTIILLTFFFQICFISVNDVIGSAITNDYKQSSVILPQLDENLPYTDYVEGLTDTFTN